MSESKHKFAIKFGEAQEDVEICYSFQFWEIMNELDLGWVHMHPMLIHDVSKVLNPLHVKRTFLQIGI